MKIAIVGAGIGGLAAAAALLQRGHPVRIYEQAARLGEVGAGIQMSANAMKVLDWLGLREALAPLAVRPQAFEFRRHDSGELLHTVPLGAGHEQRHGAPYFQLHRADLHSALLARVLALDAQAVVLDARVQGVSEDADGVMLQLDLQQSASTQRAELVIGADGVKSVLRSHVAQHAQAHQAQGQDTGSQAAVFTGQVAWRVTVPTASVAPGLRTDVVSTIWCGPRNHAVTYYLRAGELINFVGCVERPEEDESWTTRRPWQELADDYAGWHPQVQAVIDQTDRDQCYRWALKRRVPGAVWSTPRTTLLGDAAHATLPYMAQGAAMAIEDAAVLTRALELDAPLARQLVAYQRERAPRTRRVVLESSELGELYHITDAATMRAAFQERNIARSRNEWLYPYDALAVPLDAA